MKVTYIDHSGFLVETESAVFLFDYYKGELPALPAHKPMLIFASHKHRDHFDFKIFDLRRHPGGATYVFGNDIKLSDRYLQRHGVEPEIKGQIRKMAPRNMLTLSGGGKDGEERIEIHTLRSTDAGVAFYINVENKRIYHAGDLNWWHWQGEKESFNKDQERIYKEEIAYLKELLGEGNRLDLAFVPLDPRLGEAYCYGMDHFLSEILVNEVYPMHMWNHKEIIGQYLADCKKTEEKKKFIPLIKNTFFSQKQHNSITNNLYDNSIK